MLEYSGPSRMHLAREDIETADLWLFCGPCVLGEQQILVIRSLRWLGLQMVCPMDSLTIP